MFRVKVFLKIQCAPIACSSNSRDDLLLRGMFDRSEITNAFIEVTQGKLNFNFQLTDRQTRQTLNVTTLQVNPSLLVFLYSFVAVQCRYRRARTSFASLAPTSCLQERNKKPKVINISWKFEENSLSYLGRTLITTVNTIMNQCTGDFKHTNITQ